MTTVSISDYENVCLASRSLAWRKDHGEPDAPEQIRLEVQSGPGMRWHLLARSILLAALALLALPTTGCIPLAVGYVLGEDAAARRSPTVVVVAATAPAPAAAPAATAPAPAPAPAAAPASGVLGSAR